MKSYWISLYLKVENQDNLKKYAEVVTPIIKSFGGVPLVRGGKHETFEGDDFVRTVVWEFPSFKKAMKLVSIFKLSPVFLNLVFKGTLKKP